MTHRVSALRLARVSRGKTLQEVARDAAVSVAQLSRAERGCSLLRAEVYARLAQLLGVPVGTLRGGTPATTDALIAALPRRDRAASASRRHPRGAAGKRPEP